MRCNGANAEIADTRGGGGGGGRGTQDFKSQEQGFFGFEILVCVILWGKKIWLNEGKINSDCMMKKQP